MPFCLDHNSGYPSFTASYDYDHNGNRLRKTQNGQTDTYTYQAHTDILLSVTGGLTGTKTYGYDANGVARSITTNGQTLYLTPDAEDRYTRFDFNTGPGQGSAYSTAGYNGAGLRVFHHDASDVNHYNGYDGAEPGAALLSDSVNTYTPSISQRSAAAGSSYFISDAQGSLRGTHNPSTSLTNDIRFDAFGPSAGR